MSARPYEMGVCLVNRTQFLNAVAERAGAHRRDVEHVWEHAVAVITDSIKKGDRIRFSGFGTFKQHARKAGWATNPQTREKVKVAARKVPKFLPAKQFKEYVKGELKSLPLAVTKPMALAAGAAKPAAKAAPKKAAPKKKAAAKKAAPKKKVAAKKPAAKKVPAKKPAKKAAKKR